MTAEQRERQVSTITFKQALIETTFKPGRVYEGPDTIDLATVQPDIEELMDYTSSHPESHEALKVMYVYSNGRVIINKNLIAGGPTHADSFIIVSSSRIPTMSRRMSQDRFFGAHIHSHPIDSVFSPHDLQSLFLSDSDPLALTSAVLITSNRKLIGFRGQLTPQLTFAESAARVERLSAQFESRVIAHLGENPTLDQVNDINIRANRAMFRQTAQKHGLQVFEGGVKDRYLRRVATDQIAA